jgi:two-component system NarL family sensor kinase
LLELFIYMQKMDKSEIRVLILLITLVFLIGAAFVLMYILIYNERKLKHIEEKARMKLTFESEMAKTQLEVQEQTMQTIGADLHDNIGQLLSLTALTLNSIELEDAEKARQKIGAVIDLTARSIKEMRLLGKLLQGDQLVAMGLPEAILYEINWLEKSGKYEITYTDEGDMPAQNNPDKELIVFRILQEVLNNIIKHARASRININLEYLPDNLLQLKIADNGIGFDAENVPSAQRGMGLRNIQKRAAIIGGKVAIQSNTGEGTQIIILIPYP